MRRRRRAERRLLPSPPLPLSPPRHHKRHPLLLLLLLLLLLGFVEAAWGQQSNLLCSEWRTRDDCSLHRSPGSFEPCFWNAGVGACSIRGFLDTVGEETNDNVGVVSVVLVLLVIVVVLGLIACIICYCFLGGHITKRSGSVGGGGGGLDDVPAPAPVPYMSFANPVTLTPPEGSVSLQGSVGGGPMRPQSVIGLHESMRGMHSVERGY